MNITAKVIKVTGKVKSKPIIDHSQYIGPEGDMESKLNVPNPTYRILIMKDFKRMLSLYLKILSSLFMCC